MGRELFNLRSIFLKSTICIKMTISRFIEVIKKFLRFEKHKQKFSRLSLGQSRGDVPGWVLVVLMTTALVTGIWSIAAPKLTTILRNSLDAMAGIK